MVLQLIRKNKLYFTCLGLYFLIGGCFIVFQEKGTAVLFFNGNHRPAFDFVFKYITYLGDGLFVVPFLLVILLFRSAYISILMGFSVLFTFIVVQILKLWVFPYMHRPLKYFYGVQELHFVEGVNVHWHNSFPSGHSAQAFAVFLILAITTKNKFTGIIYFLMALLVTISRMYLAQHFLMDTYFGALIAVTFSMLTYLYVTRYTGLSQNERLQKGLLQ
jgi:membrane-associated phospholipid phosphatase